MRIWERWLPFQELCDERIYLSHFYKRRVIFTINASCLQALHA